MAKKQEPQQIKEEKTPAELALEAAKGPKEGKPKQDAKEQASSSDNDVMEGREEKLDETSIAELTAKNTAEALDKLNADIPTLEIQETGEKPEVSKTWLHVDELSDGDMQVEVSNIVGYQFRMCLLRIRVNGELTGQVIPVQGAMYHRAKGFQQNR